jgi:hypothetical protein
MLFNAVNAQRWWLGFHLPDPVWLNMRANKLSPVSSSIQRNTGLLSNPKYWLNDTGKLAKGAFDIEGLFIL